jgi:hypothetical protein
MLQIGNDFGDWSGLGSRDIDGQTGEGEIAGAADVDGKPAG